MRILLILKLRFAQFSDLDAFGKNEQTKRVFWALFLATAGLVLAQVLDPVTAERLAEILAGLMP